MNNQLIHFIDSSIRVKQQLLDNRPLLDTISTVINVIIRAFNNGNTVYFCGNGGSAADAQHLAAEFSGRFYKNRRALPAEALHCNTSYLTAVANDFGFEYIYSRIIDGLGKKGDILVGLSTSGNSQNIINAFEQAKSKGIITICFTGSNGGILKNVSDYTINVPSEDTPRIQETHMLIGHGICQLVEDALF